MLCLTMMRKVAGAELISSSQYWRQLTRTSQQRGCERRRELVIAIVIARKCIGHDLMNDEIGLIYIVRALRR